MPNPSPNPARARTQSPALARAVLGLAQATARALDEKHEALKTLAETEAWERDLRTAGVSDELYLKLCAFAPTDGARQTGRSDAIPMRSDEIATRAAELSDATARKRGTPKEQMKAPLPNFSSDAKVDKLVGRMRKVAKMCAQVRCMRCTRYMRCMRYMRYMRYAQGDEDLRAGAPPPTQTDILTYCSRRTRKPLTYPLTLL